MLSLLILCFHLLKKTSGDRQQQQVCWTSPVGKQQPPARHTAGLTSPVKHRLNQHDLDEIQGYAGSPEAFNTLLPNIWHMLEPMIELAPSTTRE